MRHIGICTVACFTSHVWTLNIGTALSRFFLFSWINWIHWILPLLSLSAGVTFWPLRSLADSSSNTPIEFIYLRMYVYSSWYCLSNSTLVFFSAYLHFNWKITQHMVFKHFFSGSTAWQLFRALIIRTKCIKFPLLPYYTYHDSVSSVKKCFCLS